MKKTALYFSTFLLTLFVLVPLASADTINLTLTNPVQSGVPGSTLSFDATALAVADKLGTVYLNSDSFNIASPLTLDDTGFLLNFPLSMSAGDSVTDLLFTVLLPSGLAPGTYIGSFSILGGLSPSAGEVLATVDFTINTAAPSAVPEPGTYALMATGMGVLMFVGFTRRQAGFGRAA
jgi:hypothetical protein